MTAVAMVFEMTRDYDIVLPMILAVAVALGVRRMLSRENIYTLKLVRRGHPIPKALHANMFMVRSARDAMDADFLLVDEAMSFDEFLRLSGSSGPRGSREGSNSTTGMRHVVITRGPLIVGVLRVNTDLRRTVSASASDVTMGTLARHNFTVVPADSVVFDVISRLSRRRAVMGVVVEGTGRPRAGNVVGVITKEHIADEVARSVRMYPR
jgi:CIC family chloride channel protein